MDVFKCQRCGQLLDFENTRCERCGADLGFVPERGELSALEAAEGLWRPLVAPDVTRRYCANAAYGVCNWLVAVGETGSYCVACGLNRTIPNLDQPGNLLRWQRLESAKHRLLYGLQRLGLPVTAGADGGPGLLFDFLDWDQPIGPYSAGATGYAGGVVTVMTHEADDVSREMERQRFAEPYRTLLGHFRHEVAHYYWERVVQAGGHLDVFRATFGDERADYQGGLAGLHANGPAEGWSALYVSAYASAHPWEDFAETTAHYLHMLDALETAAAFGLGVRPGASRGVHSGFTFDFDPYMEQDFDALVTAWVPFVHLANSLARSLGQADLYPFVLAPAVLGKLRVVHELLRAR